MAKSANVISFLPSAINQCFLSYVIWAKFDIWRFEVLEKELCTLKYMLHGKIKCLGFKVLLKTDVREAIETKDM